MLFKLTGRVRLIAFRDDKNISGYRLVLEQEERFLFMRYWIDQPQSRNNYSSGYINLGDFYKSYDITFSPSMVKLTDDKIREWVLSLDNLVSEFTIIRIGKFNSNCHNNQITL